MTRKKPPRGGNAKPQRPKPPAAPGGNGKPHRGITSERQELERLEGVIKDGERPRRKAIGALREIRQRDLYKSAGYATFDDYVEQRWGRTRQWATQEINVLRVVELLEAATGKDTYQFSKAAIQPISYLLEQEPEEFLWVYQEAAKAGEPVTEGAIRSALNPSRDYIRTRGMWERYQEDTKVPQARRIALTREEAQVLGDPYQYRDYSGDLVEQAKEKPAAEGKTWQECLPALCREAGKLPRPVHLLAAARGDDLEALCQPLAGLIKEWEDKKRLQQEAQEHQNKAKELRRRAAVLGRTQGEGESDGTEGKGAGDIPDEDDAQMAPLLKRVAAICAKNWPQAGPVHQQFYTPGQPIKTEQGDKRILLLVPRL